jgi:hypothetical protein
MNFKSILILLVIITYSWSNAQTVNIDGDPYGGNPYSTINAAITAANDGDVILISGIHTETLSFNKSITLRGSDPSTDIIQAAASPASDGSGSQVISIFADPATPANITIENLGIRHGNQGGINGGGIDVDKVTGLITLRNLIIEDNYTNELGGGLAIAGSNADIIECTIRNNEANKAAGGIILAPNNGAGINNVINIKHSLVDNNEGKNGGGIYINGNPNFGDDYLIDVNIENSTISNNTANSGGGAAGGGAIWSKSSTWTTNDGGDGTSANVRLELIHTTFYKNFHAANVKSGIQGTGNNNTEFSAFNSIIVYDGTSKKAINFANLNHQEVKNCILGGLNAAPGAFLDNATRNNVRGKTATFAGLSGTLSDEGGNTQVITVSENSNSDDYCTATVTGVTLPTIDQTGYTRTGTADAGAFEVRCDAPTGVANINLASTAASFSWSANPSAGSGYEYAVVLSGDDPDIPGDVVASASLASGVTQTGITGLTIDTDYDFYIRSECGTGEFSGWSAAEPFTTAFQGNLFLNSRFTDLNGDPSLDIENDGTPEWSGYGTGAELDNIIGENVGFLSNTEGLLRQDFDVIPGVTYAISFSYRWVSGTSSGNTNPPRTPVIRNDIDDALIETMPAVQTGSDTWYTYTYLYTHPTSGLTTTTERVRFQIFKADDNNQLNFYNVTVLEDRDFSANYDFVYQNGSWSPGAPSTATSLDDIYVYNGLVDITNNVSANNVEVSPWADVDVKAVLNLAGTLTADGKVDFKNDDNNLGQFEAGSLTGDVTVERYIPVATEDTRAFRFLTSTVDSNDPIFDNWQESGNSPEGFGTHITGSSTGADGFDASISGNPSMYTFDNTFTANQDNAWNEIPNTDNTDLEAGKAYILFIRGDRNYDLSSDPADAPNKDVTLRATGSLLTGSQTFVLSDIQDYYSLVGNPYQAIVDMTQVLNPTNSTNANTNFYWVWDPNMSARGAYVAVDLSSGALSNPDNIDVSSSEANEFVMPGQSFFVQTASNGTADITFTEASKDVSQNPTQVFSDNEITSINLRLYKTNDLNNGEMESDALGINFSTDASNAVDQFDAAKFTNPDENLARSQNGELLSIENRNLPADNESLALFTDGYTIDNYTFVINLSNLSTDVTAYLVDSYTGDQILLSDGDNQISFSVDQNMPGSIASDRFSILFDVDTFGIDDQQLTSNFKVYPNPVSDGNVTIKSNAIVGEAKISLHNLLGQKITEDKFEFDQNGEVNIHLDNYQSGVYYIQLNQGELSFNQKLIIK